MLRHLSLCFGLALLSTACLANDEVTVPQGINPYICKQLDGTPSGEACEAPYVPYKGDACAVYNGVDDKYQPLSEWFGKATSSCSASDVEGAKARTLLGRARLRGAVSVGTDESVNDPVSNPSYELNGAAGGEMYFAAECAVRTCGGGGDGRSNTQPAEEEETTPAPTPEPRYTPVPRYTPPPQPLVSPTFMFTACNDTNHFVVLATSERNSITQKFQTRGWWRINANTCLRLGPYTAGLFYFFASYPAGKPPMAYVNNGELLSLCVEPEQYNFFRGSRDPCTSGVRKDFSHIITYEDYTWHIHD